MRFNQLEDWLSWQETLNPVEIDLGLARVQQVLTQLGLTSTLNCSIITVAGTNGKGSVVAMIEAIASAAGKKVCCYTSPHLFKYNERIRINGQPVSDAALCESFERIDQARKFSNADSGIEDTAVENSVALTYFEFGTLAAIDIFSRSDADLIVLEVGLGGRLDAVNVMQPSVAVVTSIDIDHTDWLGNNRESIGREKAGIFREATPAICGDMQPPASLSQVADELGAEFLCIGKDYAAAQNHDDRNNDTWVLSSPFNDLDNLPQPALEGDFQLGNAATAIVSLQALANKANIAFQIGEDAYRQGLKNCHLAGRLETLQALPLVQVDVAHNPHAAKALLSQLSSDDTGGQENIRTGRCFAIMAMLADKDIEQVVDILAPAIDVWYCAGLPSVPRGLNSSELIKRVQSSLTNVKLCHAQTVKLACEKVLEQVTEDDRVIMFGSFFTASEAIDFFE